MTKRRTGGVHAANYVVHIRLPHDLCERTYCGRLRSTVNCIVSADADREGDAVCRVCKASLARSRRS